MPYIYCREYILSSCGKKLCCGCCAVKDCKSRCHHIHINCGSLIDEDPEPKDTKEEKSND